MQLFSSMLLKNKKQATRLINDKPLQTRMILEYAILGAIGIMAYGAIMSIHNSVTFAVLLQSSVNLLTLLWGSMLICLPSLYVFNSLRGSKITMARLISLVITSFAVVGMVLMGLMPVAGFFLWVGGNIEFNRAMNAAIIIMSLLFGMNFLNQGLMGCGIDSNDQAAKTNQFDALMIFFAWLVLLGVVMMQMNAVLYQL